MHIIRAVACVGVVLTHARFVLWAGGQEYLKQYPVELWAWYEFPLFFLDLITSLGRPRVFFFFILSGFFLQYSGRKNFSVSSFLRARFLRLYPAYLAATLAALAVFYVALTYINPLLATASGREFNVLLYKAAADLSWTSLGHTLFFASRDSAFAATPHFWSMLHEVVFCLLFPIYHRLSIQGRVGLAGVVLLVGWTVNSLLIQSQLFFLLGMLFYDCLSRGYRLPYRFPKWTYMAAFLGLYLATYAMGKMGAHWLACLPMVVLAYLLFEFVLTQTIRVPRLCLLISKASYSIYLNHLWALLLYYAVLSRLTGTVVFYSRWPYYLGALVALALSMPAYHLVEKRVGTYLFRLKQSASPPQLVVERLVAHTELALVEAVASQPVYERSAPVAQLTMLNQRASVFR